MKKTDVIKVTKSYFSKQKDVLCAYLFGSVAVERDNKFSDVDFALLLDSAVKKDEYSRKKLRFADELSSLTDRNVDVVVLNEAGSFLKFQVISEGTLVYERSHTAACNFEARTVLEYFDFLPIKKRLEKAMISSIKET